MDIQRGIFLCTHCGEKMKSKAKFCKFCKTAAQRKEIDKENALIKAAQKAKGWVV